MKNSHIHQKRVGLHLFYHSIILIFSVIIAVALYKLGFFNFALLLAGKLKLLGAFLSGMLYASGVTVGPAAIFLIDLAKTNSILLLSVTAGFGAALGDSLLFKLVRSTITADIHAALENIHNGTMRSLIHSTILKWALPILGILLIASPLPDEIGLALLGLSNISLIKLFPLFWGFNSVGLFLLITVGQTVI